MKPKATHSFVKRPNSKCAWCEKPRLAHAYEIIRDEQGGLQKVAIEEAKTK